VRGLSESVALATPTDGDLAETEAAIYQARRGEREVEIRIGVGPLTGGIPLRVLGHAACIAESLRTDVPAVVRHADRICIFSSALKAGNTNMGTALQSLAALGGALRLSGVTCPLLLDLAAADQEVPATVPINLPRSLVQWFERAALRSSNNADPTRYAIEHAAPTMFADLSEDRDVPLRLTIGSAPEARFWAARMHVRAAAITAGFHVVPALGLILKSLLVPWYSRTAAEPLLTDMKFSAASAIASLDDASNPEKKGNSGLKREARATRRFMQRSDVIPFIEAVSDTRKAAVYVRECGFGIGAHLAREMAVLL